MSGGLWRRRRAGLLSAGVMFALLLRSRGVPLLLPGCPLRALTGVPCPTCFLTRSAIASLQGDLGEALELHLFGPPLVLGLGWLGWRQGVRGRPLPALTRQRVGLLLMLLATVLIYWLVRLTQWLWMGVPHPG